MISAHTHNNKPARLSQGFPLALLVTHTQSAIRGRNWKPIFYVFAFLFLTACQHNSAANWPSQAPSRDLFEREAVKRIDNRDPAIERKVKDYLLWIKRFYQGSILYPLGWNEMTELVVESLDEEDDRQLATQKLFDLGFEISREWAQENDARKITSANIATWGSALRTASESDQQLEFIRRVESDVAALLAGELSSKEISRERYYPQEDYDNF